jgi:hypothetical protein
MYKCRPFFSLSHVMYHLRLSVKGKAFIIFSGSVLLSVITDVCSVTLKSQRYLQIAELLYAQHVFAHLSPTNAAK